VTEKSLGIPAIREIAIFPQSVNLAENGQKNPKLAASLCQARLFHIDENSALESRAPDSQNELSGGESAPGGSDLRVLSVSRLLIARDGVSCPAKV
jgi:hypothetical protein